ncbi:hypothetical protein [Kitasatospora sp. NBC_01302]|uniref:hypothetical protein n=1 Tax=Kitasatospora sp. NBC_01302 TaxID=2903575 RepID=UPI002E0D110C|nr:hypothetical protein OG294_18290 [Kitasatospora sp. NBC_01302]
MDSKVAAVLQGFIALTPTQRAEFVTVVNEYIGGNPPIQDRLTEESRRDWIIKVDLGPTSQICPCCGR